MARWKIPYMMRHSLTRHFLYNGSHALQNHTKLPKTASEKRRKKKEASEREKRLSIDNGSYSR